MSVLYTVINLDKREYICPYKYVNLKEPEVEPYSSFIVFVMRWKWNEDSIMFMSDANPFIEYWQNDSEKDKTEEYWKEFMELYPELVKE